MMYCHDGNGVVGVLTDWDLSTVLSFSSTPNTDHTGTKPFMALQLLSGDTVVHMFRHDAESFIWLFLWVCGCSDGSKKEVLVAPYKVWRKLDMLACKKDRGAFLANVGLEDIKVSDHHASNGLFCLFLAWLLQQLLTKIWKDIPTSANHNTQEQKDMTLFSGLLPKFAEVRRELNMQFSPKDWSDHNLRIKIQLYITTAVESIIRSIMQSALDTE